MIRLALSITASILLASCGDKSAKTPKARSSIEFVTLESGAPKGVLRGVVEFDGTPPPRLPLAMSGVEGCGATGAKALSETLVVEDGRVANVLVRVKSGPSLREPAPAPNESERLDQTGCTFAPHVLALRVGQKLVIRNDDSTTHNVNLRPSRAANASLNKMQPPGATELELAFTEPELSIPVRCDVHPWMQAWVHVLEHPYFAVTRANGAFEIAGLAPGHYELEVVHEWLGRATHEIDLSADAGLELAVRMRAPVR